MARTREQIQQSIITEIQNHPVLGPLATSTSRTAIWRLLTFVIAVCIWTLETLFDLHKSEIEAIILEKNPHTRNWYANVAKQYQHGYSLPPDAFMYDNTGLDATVIENSKIVAQSAAVELERSLRIKVARLVSGELAPLTNDQLTGLTVYMQRIKDAGVRLEITSGQPDSLKLSVDCYYDPLILNSLGQRLDGNGNTTVQNGVKDFLKTLPFNGVLELESLTDNQQKIEGVKIFHIKQASARYGALPFTNFDVKYVPDAGYLRFETDADLQINFIPYSE